MFWVDICIHIHIDNCRHSPIHGPSTKPTIIQMKSPGYTLPWVPHFRGWGFKRHPGRTPYVIRNSILFLHFTHNYLRIIHSLYTASFLIRLQKFIKLISTISHFTNYPLHFNISSEAWNCQHEKTVHSHRRNPFGWDQFQPTECSIRL